MGLIPARAGTTGDGVLLDEHSGAHPRSRGDHYPPGNRARVDGGSSPLARGPLFDGLKAIVENGLIPARAGTTACVALKFAGSRAHPRSRGDHGYGKAHYRSYGGSSPLARGPPCSGYWLDFRGGLIPARAGTTTRPCLQIPIRRAHPRSRGDHVARGRLERERAGSSPLARGPLRPIARDTRAVGLIPARAGTTSVLNAAFKELGAHPRSRGDHPLPGNPSTPARGSSPLARGPLASLPWAWFGVGLIPARAGTTRFFGRRDIGYGAHPRSRGDHSAPLPLLIRPLGSSPLARGPLYKQGYIYLRAGLIPARAGTTTAHRRPGLHGRAHPRSRGDHVRTAR